MRCPFFQKINQLRPFFFRIGLKGSIGCTFQLLIPNPIDQLRRATIGANHISHNYGNLFKSNGSIPLFALQHRKKIRSAIVAKAPLINPSMRVELKTAHFTINFVAIFN
jgi:hypothetical protein